jgi:hypothetical protein
VSLFRYRPGRWIFTVLVVVGATLLARWIEPLLALGSPFALPFLYFGVVLGIAFRHGAGPAVLATVGSAAAIAFITVASPTPGMIDSRDLLLKIVFFAAESLLAAAFIHAARRSARGDQREAVIQRLHGPPPPPSR